MDREYHRNYSRNYYHKRRQEVIEALGGKCARCESTGSLDIDHIDHDNKKFEIGRLLNYSKKDVNEEIKKCQLLCRKCHIEKNTTERSFMKNRKCELKYTPERIAELYEEYKNTGVTLRFLGSKYKINRTTLSKRFKRQFPICGDHPDLKSGGA